MCLSTDFPCDGAADGLDKLPPTQMGMGSEDLIKGKRSAL
jgi:hypothetical protein